METEAKKTKETEAMKNLQHRNRRGWRRRKSGWVLILASQDSSLEV